MIFVTGASGFVGKILVGKLANERPLRIATRKLREEVFKNVEVVQSDLMCDQDWTSFLVNVDVVVHCAARVHVMKDHASDPLAEFRRVNVDGTIRLASQAAGAGVRRFIFISSIKVNGESTNLGNAFRPDDTPNPIDSYGISKLEAEQGLREISARTGMEVVVIRPPLIYGPGVKGNFDSMIRWLKRGLPLPLGDITNNRRSFVNVDNLVDLLMICIDHQKAANQTFLVSDEDDVSTAELLHRIADALECKARLVRVSPSILKIFSGSKVFERISGSLQVDITKTKEVLGWKPKFSMEAGLLQIASSMRTKP